MTSRRDRFASFSVKFYRRSPFWYWLRYMQSDPLRLVLGGRFYGEDFWFHLNMGWHDMEV